MNNQIVSVIVVEGGKLLSEILRLRLPRSRPITVVERPAEEPPPPLPTVAQLPEKAITGNKPDEKVKKGIACLPCTNSHLHTCVGLLNEAVRMSPEGLNTDSMERVDKCLGEIAAAERVDLSPENVAKLSHEERPIAETAAKEIREIRHGLEGLNSKEELSDLAVKASNLQGYVGKEWFKLRLAKMPPDEKEKVVKAAVARLENDGA